MTTAQHSHPYQQSHLPPSPPPSPPQPRHRATKKKQKPHDPFLELSNSPPSPPETEHEEDQESILHRIIFTPILFTSFLLSLFLINHRDRRRRLDEHTTTSTLLAYLSPSTWLDPEPYQDPSNTTWDRRGSLTHVEPHSVLNPELRNGGEQSATRNRKRNSWHLRKKIRKVAKLEVSDAFEMRGRVIVLMVSVGMVGLAGLVWGVKSVAVGVMMRSRTDNVRG